LNCAVNHVTTDASASTGSQTIKIISIKAYCSMAETWHVFNAPLLLIAQVMGSLVQKQVQFLDMVWKRDQNLMNPFAPTNKPMKPWG
jgi:hypothetical protein